jgi:hypothetical protein
MQAALEGRLPRGVGVANLRDAPAERRGRQRNRPRSAVAG